MDLDVQKFIKSLEDGMSKEEESKIKLSTEFDASEYERAKNYIRMSLCLHRLFNIRIDISED